MSSIELKEYLEQMEARLTAKIETLKELSTHTKKEYYTMTELCERIGKTKATIHRWLELRLITGIRTNRNWKFSHEELERIKTNLKTQKI